MKINYTYNPKLSSEKFTEDELKMIREIKKAGYKIQFVKGGKDAYLLEPYKSIITGKIYNIELGIRKTIH